ncbi:DNA topology modulation protein FlaR [Nanoarchaeota archaeon]
MKIKKIHIIGGPGSGKSYISNRLSNSLKIPYYDLDDLHWNNKSKKYNIKIPEDVRDKNLKKILKKDRWIIEGVYYKWVQNSFSKADIIIVLKVGVYTRAWKILKRFILRKLGLAKAKKESIRDLIDLLKWNNTYDNDWLIKTEANIKKFKRKTKYFNKADYAINYILNFV